MSFDDLVETSVHQRYSKKVAEKILNARNAGYFLAQDAQMRQMRYVESTVGSFLEGMLVVLYWLVDETDGVIVDAKFQVFGPASLIAAAESACELVIGKNYDQAKRIGAELIDKKLRDKPDIAAFPMECYSYLDTVVRALEIGAQQCIGISLATNYVTPVPATEPGLGYPGWLSLSKEQKLAVIEEVINTDVRPYIELDEGGIEVQELIGDREVIIAYTGACTSCYSSIGSTLSTIQQIIQTKIYHSLVVVPNMEGLKL